MHHKEVCITVYYNPADPKNPDEENQGQYQFHDFDIIPRIGETFAVWSCKDEDGNIYPGGRPQERFTGIVQGVKYVYEYSQPIPGSTNETLFVELILRNPPIGI